MNSGTEFKTVRANCSKTTISVLNDLLIYRNEQHDGKCFYKKSLDMFKKQYGISLAGAPMIYEHNGYIVGLSHRVYEHKGKKYETISYLPFAECKGKFKQLDFNRFSK